MSNPSYFHDCLSGIGEIIRLSELNMDLYTGWLDVSSRKKGPRQLQIFRKHWQGMRKIMHSSKPANGYFLREWSTIPLWLCMKIFRLEGNDFTLLVHHNLQWALERKWNRRAFQCLQKMGVHLLFFEFVPEEVLVSIEMTTDNCSSLPMPITKLNSVAPIKSCTVGLIGTWSANSLGALENLLKSEGVERVLIGASNVELAEKELSGREERIEFRDTTLPADFDAAIQACQVIYLPYPEDLYRYRVSGLLTDAIRNRVPVLVPDYPMLRHQVEWPVSVGQIIQEGELLAEALDRILSKTFDFEKYAEDRSEVVLGDMLKKAFGEVQ